MIEMSCEPNGYLERLRIAMQLYQKYNRIYQLPIKSMGKLFLQAFSLIPVFV